LADALWNYFDDLKLPFHKLSQEEWMVHITAIRQRLVTDADQLGVLIIFSGQEYEVVQAAVEILEERTADYPISRHMARKFADINKLLQAKKST